MASLLSGIGTLYLLFALVIISHALQIGIVVMVAALAAGAVLLTRPAGARDDVPDTDVPDAYLPDSYLSPAEQLAVELAEEPSERIPAQRSATPTRTGAERVPEPAGR